MNLKKWHRMLEPNVGVSWALMGLDFVLLLLTVVNGIYFVFFLLFSVLIAMYFPIGFKKKILIFLKDVGVVRDIRDKNYGYYLSRWPRVTYRITEDVKSFRVYEVSFENDDRISKKVEDIFGMRLQKMTIQHGYYQFDLIPEAEKKYYEF